MFLQVLRALEGFSAEVTFVWFERNMDTDMADDVVALDSGSTAATPLASQAEVVCALAADMAFTDVVLQVENVC